MTTAIDVETGLDEFFKAQGSTEAQRADAVAILKDKCGMVRDVVILTATGEALDSDASKKWIAEHKPHLLPPKVQTSLADQAFIGRGNKTAAQNLIRQIGKTEADKLAVTYGKAHALDDKPGKACCHTLGMAFVVGRFACQRPRQQREPIAAASVRATALLLSACLGASR